MTHWFGRFGPVSWSVVSGNVTPDVFDAFCDHLEALAKRQDPGQLVLDIFHDISRPTAIQRQRAANILANAPNLKLVAGHAFVTNSVVGRGALTAINWMFKKEFPERVFPNPPDAMAWLAQQNPALVPGDLARHLQQVTGGTLDRLAW